ncbi:Transcriptional regulator SlyA [Fundidesulfovibrio magnetotacticus]|uniref:Transcriptional regulator SlyA n=1 Tax=Fundidesulfovibrio magnetotacticus TaxID=2730080 RepID=A0A6V8M280_9BACT|nr:MarR family transcriptional regulator [Fundidesulfovibrio magnetotacticus]GFK94555.1 Transcriptional regulator SlyA [Fundidesulfovibrio magnetotacticus]
MAFECCRADRSEPRMLGLLIYEVAKAWRNQLDERLKPMGLSTAMWTVVWNLAMAAQPMTQKALADAMSMEASSMVRLLDRLEEGGWVRRESVVGDRRSKHVTLTDKVLPVVERFEQIAREFSELMLQGLPEERLRQCSAVLMTLKGRLDALALA